MVIEDKISAIVYVCSNHLPTNDVTLSTKPSPLFKLKQNKLGVVWGTG